MSASQPLVVIGIPTFNRCVRLQRAIESALAQDYPNVEVLVSDNASTDDTARVCASHAQADARFRYYRQERNVGGTGNFIDLLQRSRGDFFVWLADDDWLDPDFVSTCVRVLVERPEVVLAGGGARYYRDGVYQRQGPAMRCASSRSWLRVLQYYCQVEENAIYYGVMRREPARRAGLKGCLGGDWLFVAAMAYQGKIQTIEGPHVNRSLGGASDNLRHMARALGAPAWQARVPLTVTLALNAARDIVSGSPAYSLLSLPQRAALALVVACCIGSLKPIQELGRRICSRRTNQQ
jgi:glycosyltransferase involved in cell wall biosynthesis